MRDWIFVTGFGPFPGVEVNPTQTLAESLATNTICGMPVVSQVLDVSFARSAKQLQDTLSRGTPRFMVHFGVASRSEHFRIETQAVNRKSSGTPDVDGECFKKAVIHSDYPLDAILLTTAPAKHIASTLKARGFPALVSNNAGRYVCNSIYFNALAWVEASQTGIPSVFVHVPPVTTDPKTAHSGKFRWTHKQILAAAVQVLQCIADHPETGMRQTHLLRNSVGQRFSEGNVKE